jgi:hypothetical protein
MSSNSSLFTPTNFSIGWCSLRGIWWHENARNVMLQVHTTFFFGRKWVQNIFLRVCRISSRCSLRALTVWDVARRSLVAASSGQHISLILNGQATQEEITKLYCLALDNERRCSAVAVTSYQITPLNGSKYRRTQIFCYPQVRSWSCLSLCTPSRNTSAYFQTLH